MAVYDIIQAQYVASAVHAAQYPEEKRPEIAFLGRSNVGKSSLINSLCNHKGLARVSSAPGKTQTINYFSAALRCRDEEREERLPFYLVDLPGYGFARTGGKKREAWSSFIGEYVTHSEDLCLLCLLVDLRHPGLYIDGEAYAWLMNSGVPLQIVATKADKLKAREKQQNLRKINELFQTGRPALAYSSLKRDGFGTLVKRLFGEVKAFTTPLP